VTNQFGICILGAALVDHHDIAVRSHRSIRDEKGKYIERRSARTTLYHEQWIRLHHRPLGGQHCYRYADGWSIWISVALGDNHIAALVAQFVSRCRQEQQIRCVDERAWSGYKCIRLIYIRLSAMVGDLYSGGANQQEKDWQYTNNRKLF